ncbi:glutamate--tRNA ligase [Verrucomicrobiales bacterium]|jgi:glutamyl-tRNA synthetase|nr:glutamate--tRNA ligase [Verrucomicrobiales bacterium]MDA9924743.1 glutamate--tRNA ligase [Verrucomicrobiales bacterium]MDB2495643.1 glutamate--tRNA ligase [Verrucomicrobiales bacterium]
MTVRTRFAPSPTGFLHIGGARTALYNYLYARKNRGSFILRVEDTDAERNTESSMDIILDSMKWLGLDWDEGPRVGGEYGPYNQSERSDIYDRYLGQLEENGHIYEDDGAIRFRVPDKTITVHDKICGDVSANLKEQGSLRYNQETKKEEEANPDIVIRRPDGSYIFHFVNVVDDIEMGITNVIRGEDHISNTPKHLALFEAIGATPPVFAHIPLNLNPSGSKMGKRDEGALIHEYRNGGFLPEAVNNYMALLGWSAKDDTEIFTMAELTERFDLPGVTKSNSKFDFAKCKWVNAEHLKRLSPEALLEAARSFVDNADLPADDPRMPAALELARERAEVLAEIPDVIETIFADEATYDDASVEKVKSREGVADVVKALRDSLTVVDDWNVDSIKASLAAAAEGIGAKMGALMLPCRVGVMGSTSGADLIPVLELIGKEGVLKRLDIFVEKLA